MKTACFLSTVLFILPAALAAADDETAKVALPDTPAAVQKAIASQIANGRVDSIERSRENGETIFEVDFTTKDGADSDFTVANDGTLLKLGVALDDLSPAVRKSVQAQLHGRDIVGINKNVADTEVSFDVTVSKDGREQSFNVADNGTLNSVEMALAETPAAVQASVKAQTAGGKVQSVEEDFDPDGNSFDVELMTEMGGKKSISVAPDGRLLSVEVTIDQIPPAVRNTITEKIGDGKILEIDKSLFEKKNNVLPYQVQGRKDGKPFNFSVGPRGRFLGMDE